MTAGPDLVWFTAGGNDLANDKEYHDCLDNASSYDAAAACARASVKRW